MTRKVKKSSAKKPVPKPVQIEKEEDLRWFSFTVIIGSIIYIIGLFLPFRYSFPGPETAVEIFLLGPFYIFIMAFTTLMGTVGFVKKKDYGGILLFCVLVSGLEIFYWFTYMFLNNPLFLKKSVHVEFGIGIYIVMLGSLVNLAAVTGMVVVKQWEKRMKEECDK